MFCRYCGKEVAANYKVCPNCGHALVNNVAKKKNNGLRVAAKVLMIIMTVVAIVGCLICLVIGGIIAIAANTTQAENAGEGLGLGIGLAVGIVYIMFGLILLIPVIYMSIMTRYYSKRIKKGLNVGMAFKIATLLLFFNPIPGILMLVDSE